MVLLQISLKLFYIIKNKTHRWINVWLTGKKCKFPRNTRCGLSFRVTKRTITLDIIFNNVKWPPFASLKKNGKLTQSISYEKLNGFVVLTKGDLYCLYQFSVIKFHTGSHLTNNRCVRLKAAIIKAHYTCVFYISLQVLMKPQNKKQINAAWHNTWTLESDLMYSNISIIKSKAYL